MPTPQASHTRGRVRPPQTPSPGVRTCQRLQPLVNRLLQRALVGEREDRCAEPLKHAVRHMRRDAIGQESFVMDRLPRERIRAQQVLIDGPEVGSREQPSQTLYEAAADALVVLVESLGPG